MPYSAAQLQAMTLPFEAHALAALAAGDLPEVQRLLREMAQGHAGLDALSAHTLARKVGKLRVDFGEERAQAVLLRIGAQLMATWVTQWQAGQVREAIADLVAVHRYQGDAVLETLEEDDDAVTLRLSPCGSGGKLERQRLPERHPAAYGGWSDGVSSYCQGCKANQAALNQALDAPAWSTQKAPDGRCTLRFAKLQQHGQTLFSDEERTTLT